MRRTRRGHRGERERIEYGRGQRAYVLGGGNAKFYHDDTAFVERGTRGTMSSSSGCSR